MPTIQLQAGLPYTCRQQACPPYHTIVGSHTTQLQAGITHHIIELQAGIPQDFRQPYPLYHRIVGMTSAHHTIALQAVGIATIITGSSHARAQTSQLHFLSGSKLPKECPSNGHAFNAHFFTARCCTNSLMHHSRHFLFTSSQSCLDIPALQKSGCLKIEQRQRRIAFLCNLSVVQQITNDSFNPIRKVLNGMPINRHFMNNIFGHKDSWHTFLLVLMMGPNNSFLVSVCLSWHHCPLVPPCHPPSITSVDPFLAPANSQRTHQANGIYFLPIRNDKKMEWISSE